MEVSLQSKLSSLQKDPVKVKFLALVFVWSFRNSEGWFAKSFLDFAGNEAGRIQAVVGLQMGAGSQKMQVSLGLF